MKDIILRTVHINKNSCPSIEYSTRNLKTAQTAVADSTPLRPTRSGAYNAGRFMVNVPLQPRFCSVLTSLFDYHLTQ